MLRRHGGIEEWRLLARQTADAKARLLHKQADRATERLDCVMAAGIYSDGGVVAVSESPVSADWRVQ